MLPVAIKRPCCGGVPGNKSFVHIYIKADRDDVNKAIGLVALCL